MRLDLRVLSFAVVLAPMLVLGCDKTSPDSQPPTEQPTTAPQPEAPTTAWGDGSLSGTVTLKWGAPAPEGSTLQLRVYRGGEVVHQHDMQVSGAGPWEFTLKVPDTSSFADDQLFGVGATIVVPPNSESWYMGDPATTQIWQKGAEQGAVALAISPINPKAAGSGPPK